LVNLFRISRQRAIPYVIDKNTAIHSPALVHLLLWHLQEQLFCFPIFEANISWLPSAADR
ncbi:hypothetical protein, partial [Acidaminococcus fermentans]|uniref:hypothetical protein n=1 Tax=Acidaminococcus fermentans TaxID=905 RepID=UPI0030793DA1